MPREQLIASLSDAMHIIKERRMSFIDTNLAVWGFLNHAYLTLEKEQFKLQQEVFRA